MKKQPMDKLKNALSITAALSLPFIGLFNILEIWSYWPDEFTWTDIFSKAKYTLITLFLLSLIMGLLIQAAERAQNVEQ